MSVALEVTQPASLTSSSTDLKSISCALFAAGAECSPIEPIRSLHFDSFRVTMTDHGKGGDLDTLS